MTLMRSLRRLEMTVKGIARLLAISALLYFIFVRGGFPLLLVMDSKPGVIECGKEKTEAEIFNVRTVRLGQSSLRCIKRRWLLRI